MEKEIIGYKLLKDAPDVPKNSIGIIREDFIVFKSSDNFKSNIITDDSFYSIEFCKNNPDWFEPVYKKDELVLYC